MGPRDRRSTPEVPVDPGSEFERLGLLYDEQHNVETQERVAVEDLAIDGRSAEFAERYGSTPVLTFRTILDQLDIEFANYSFLDYGAGKGRTMFLAADYPFARILGVELASNVYQVGLRNIRTFRSDEQRCFDIELIKADATDVELPDGNVVAYLSAPFWGLVMDRVLDNIRQLIAEDPRDVILIWTDEDVPDSETEHVAERIESWGTMEQLQIALPSNDPGARLPRVGTYWASRPRRS
jgi:hypothetical protein